MKKKFLISTLFTFVLLATTVLAVRSDTQVIMRYGNVDGTWGEVDQGLADPNSEYMDGAGCLRYADGPDGSNTNPNNLNDGMVFSDTDRSIQGNNTTNWNQVRYGGINVNGSCGSNDMATYQKQSGLAFNGVDATTPKRVAPFETYFPLGKLSHVNHSIYLVGNNRFQQTYIDLVIKDVDCGPDGVLVQNKNGTPYPDPVPTSLDLSYRFLIFYDETYNTGLKENCPYLTTGRACSDAIIPGQLQGGSFFCKYDYATKGENSQVFEFQVSLHGFTPVGLYESVENLVYDPDSVITGLMISEEDATNSVAIWARVGPVKPTAIDMNFFEANGAEESIVLRWQTAFETDNIGFNVYRSETLIRENAVQLNQKLIASLVPPGSTFGADYEFVDDNALPYTTYFYWIEDVDVNGTVTIHGPMAAEWVD